MADNTDFHQVVLYYLNLFHVLEEIKEMVHLQFLTDFKKWWRHQTLELNQIVEMWDLSGGSCVNADFFLQQEGVEKLGLGHMQSHFRLGWFQWLELGAICEHKAHGNQQALRAQPWKVCCVAPCIFHSLICPTPGLLPITSITSSSYLHWSCLHWSLEKGWLWTLQSPPYHHVVTLGPLFLHLQRTTIHVNVKPWCFLHLPRHSPSIRPTTVLITRENLWANVVPLVKCWAPGQVEDTDISVEIIMLSAWMCVTVSTFVRGQYQVLTSVDLFSILHALKKHSLRFVHEFIIANILALIIDYKVLFTSCPHRHPTPNSFSTHTTYHHLSFLLTSQLSTQMPITVDLGNLYASKTDEQKHVEKRIRSHYHRRKMWLQGVVSACVKYVLHSL